MRQTLLRLVRFLVLAAAAFVAAGLLVGLGGALLGKRPDGGTWAFAASFALLLLLANWTSLRMDGEPISALGLTLGPPRVTELCLGFIATASLFAAVGLARAMLVGASWQFWGVGGLQAALLGLPLALLLALIEELLFRGYAFRQLIALCGARHAALLSALAFGLYHLALAGFRPWGMGAVLVFGLPVLGGLLFGAAAIRTRGLALPLGLHLGGNWIQASVLGLGVAPGAPPSALFTAALTQGQAHTLTAPDLLPQLPYLIALGTAALLVAHWPASPASARPAMQSV